MIANIRINSRNQDPSAKQIKSELDFPNLKTLIYGSA